MVGYNYRTGNAWLGCAILSILVQYSAPGAPPRISSVLRYGYYGSPTLHSIPRSAQVVAHPSAAT